MPFTKAVVPDNAVPPVAAAYHLIAVPVATKFATVPELPEQNVCDNVPVGAAGLAVSETVTFSLAELSQELTVWLA